MKIRFLLVIFALLLMGALQSQAQVSANEVSASGNVTYFKYLIPHAVSDATQTLPVDVSRASSATILVATGSTVAGAILNSASATVQGKSGTLSTATATFAAVPPSLGGSTETLTSYGVKHYVTAGLSFMRISVAANSGGMILILGIKED